jgi:hypothetical protein
LPLSEIAKPTPVYSAFTYRFLSCDAVGFDNSFFGITSSDALLISWAAAMVLIAAYKFTVIKKMFF